MKIKEKILFYKSEKLEIHLRLHVLRMGKVNTDFVVMSSDSKMHLPVIL